MLAKNENIVVLSVLFIFTFMLAFTQYYKGIYDSPTRADSAFILEVTSNIAEGKGPVSSIHAAMNNFFSRRSTSFNV
jgi:hypothetical protein